MVSRGMLKNSRGACQSSRRGFESRKYRNDSQQLSQWIFFDFSPEWSEWNCLRWTSICSFQSVLRDFEFEDWSAGWWWANQSLVVHWQESKRFEAILRRYWTTSFEQLTVGFKICMIPLRIGVIAFAAEVGWKYFNMLMQRLIRRSDEIIRVKSCN